MNINKKINILKMAAWFVIVLLAINQVLARDCSEMEKIMNCNECIRCGGYWCNKPELGERHCTSEKNDEWCPSDKEILAPAEDISVEGTFISPVYSERTAFIHTPNRIHLNYSSSIEPKVDITVVNTTQNFHIDMTAKTECVNGKCTTVIQAIPDSQFCSQTGRTSEYVNVKVFIMNIDEDVLMKYHVPCACECSKKVEKNSRKCSERGDFSCGVCSCQNGWDGEFCEKKICESNRGDLQCTNPTGNDAECSGNGFCNTCQSCECYTDREGSQYFDKDNYCADICMTTNYCDECFRTPIPGACEYCQSPQIIIQPYNQSLLSERDAHNRKVWVNCNETLPDGCYVEYAAMKDENGEVFVMVINLCNTITAAFRPGSVNITVPVILGVIGLIAAAAAVTAFMVHKNRAPPLPLTDPQYQNIDAEDCVGENPLYKPPTSSFKNPTYGKW